MIPNSVGSFVFDDGMGQNGRWSRGTRLRVYNITDRTMLSMVVQHFPGEILPAYRDSAKIIEFQGHIFANPALTEFQLAQNIDTLVGAFENGIQPLCVWDDGRYIMSELYSFEATIVPGSPYHTRYQARFWAGDPFAWGPVTYTYQQYANGTTMTSDGGTLYHLDFNSALVGTLPLGSAPSDVNITVTFQTSNGAFFLRLNDNNTGSPKSSWSIGSNPTAGGVYLNGDSVTFDSLNQHVLYNGSYTEEKDFVVDPLRIDPVNGTTQTSRLYVRANGGAPVVGISQTYTPRYK